MKMVSLFGYKFSIRYEDAFDVNLAFQSLRTRVHEICFKKGVTGVHCENSININSLTNA